jgi:hypothetical protein
VSVAGHTRRAAPCLTTASTSFFAEQFARAAAFFRVAREVEAKAEEKHGTNNKERRSAPWVVAALLFRLHDVLDELDDYLD